MVVMVFVIFAKVGISTQKGKIPPKKKLHLPRQDYFSRAMKEGLKKEKEGL